MLVKLMGKTSFSVTGIDNLEKKLKRNANLNDVKDVVRLNTSEMQTKMQRFASFRGHYQGSVFVKPTGATKRSIAIEMKDGGFTGVVAPHTHYAYYLEKGTRYMTAQPFLRPAFYPQAIKFKKDLYRLMK